MNVIVDILVVGAGMAGVSAAIGAAQQGKKVLLIDNHSYPGGAATGAQVGTICGLFENGKKDNAAFIVDGFAKEFAEKLMKRFQLKPAYNQLGLHYLPYNVDELKSFLEDELAQNNVLCMFDTDFIGVDHDDKLLKSALIFCNNQSVEVEFKALVDCSGKASVATMLNHPMVESTYFQAASINFYVENSLMDGSELMNFKLIRALKLAQMNGDIADNNIQLFVIPGSCKNESIGFKLTLPWPHDPFNKFADQLADKAKVYVNNYFKVLTEKVAIFANARIQFIAEDLGWRTAQRPVGKYILTEEDILSARKFTPSCAKSAWPIEEWLPTNSVALEFLKEGAFYEIPADCLQSVVYTNYFFAGRIISATDRAIASARVMGICLQTGFYAGCLAAEKCNN